MRPATTRKKTAFLSNFIFCVTHTTKLYPDFLQFSFLLLLFQKTFLFSILVFYFFYFFKFPYFIELVKYPWIEFLCYCNKFFAVAVSHIPKIPPLLLNWV